MIKYVLEKEVETVKRKALTVSDLTRRIKSLLEEGLSNIWIEGEISNFKLHSSGHMYFSLKDEQSQVGCVMFRRENSSLAFEPADGMQVLCYGRVSVYAPRGQYQIYVERIEPKGVGALQMRFQQMREKLQKEGLFDEARKRPIPFLARRIALVTSQDGAALQDILNVLGRRFSSANLLICHVPVQGAQAAGEIADMIDYVSENDSADVMIVARGGGSLEDLWAFNEEAVARAIFRSAIPVISAVGHETDFTIADFVADLRAPTPSAAAELVLPRREDLLERLRELRSRMRQSVLGLVDERRETLKALLGARVLRDPLFAFETRFQKLDELVRGLSMRAQMILSSKKESVSALVGKLEALGPLSTLKRGFSATLKLPAQTLLTSVRSVKVGDEIKTRLQDGFLKSRIMEVSNGG